MRIAVVLTILCFSHLHAQEYEDTEIVEEPSHELVEAHELETTRAYQSGDLVIRKFDDAKWKEIVGEVDYREKPQEKENDESMDLGDISLPWAAPLLKFISYTVIIAVVLVLLYYVVTNISLDARIKRTEMREDPSHAVEDIEELDIGRLLEQAKDEGNFKVAVRMYYLGLLKKLHELGAISWKKDKTNRDYLMELLNRDFYYDEVQRLTISYETIWYGDHVVKPEFFQHLSTQFETVYVKLNTQQRS